MLINPIMCVVVLGARISIICVFLSSLTQTDPVETPDSLSEDALT